MKRGPAPLERKRELYQTVEALEACGWSAGEIAEALCYSSTQIRNVFRRLGLVGKLPLPERIAALPAHARRRVEQWRANYCVFENEIS